MPSEASEWGHAGGKGWEEDTEEWKEGQGTRDRGVDTVVEEVPRYHWDVGVGDLDPLRERGLVPRLSSVGTGVTETEVCLTSDLGKWGEVKDTGTLPRRPKEADI